MRPPARQKKTYESRFGKISDEEETLKVKNLMPGERTDAPATHDALIIALENIVLDTATPTPCSTPKNSDTRRPLDIGMAAGDESYETRDGEEQQISDITVQASSVQGVMRMESTVTAGGKGLNPFDEVDVGGSSRT